jgi:hypothetical protein
MRRNSSQPKLPTVVAPNTTITDDTTNQILSRLVARLAAKGAKLENIAVDGWAQTARGTRWNGRHQRRWFVDATIRGEGGAEVWGCIVIVETEGMQPEVGLFTPSAADDAAFGQAAAFRVAIGWR